MPSTASEGYLDVFMRMVVGGVRFPGIDSLCSSLVRQCEYDSPTSLYHRVMVGTAALNDMLRMRDQLKQQLDTSPAFRNAAKMSDPIMVAAYAATGFFFTTTDTILVSLHEQIASLAPNGISRLPIGVREKSLKAERASTLDRVTARFKFLAVMDPKVRFKAPAALRVIRSTVLSIGVPSNAEAAALLLVLE